MRSTEETTMSAPAREPRIIEVTRAQVEAAKLYVEMSQRLREEPDAEIAAVAAAKPLRAIKR